MKQNTLSRMAVAIATLLVAITGCTNDTLSIDAPAPGDQGNGENRTTIQVSLPDGNGGSGAQTRTDYKDDPDPDKGVKVTWRTGDKLRVSCMANDGTFPSEIFTLKGEGGGVSGVFEGVAPKPEGGDALMYFIFYPSTAYRNDAGKLAMSMEGQMQSGDKNTDHLGNYDVLLGNSMNLSDPWTFIRYTTMLRFDIDLSGSDYDATLDGVPYAIVLSSSVESTFYKGFPESDNKTNSLTLSLKDIDISTSKKFTAYMMAAPFDLTTDFSVSVLCSKGQKYTSKRTLTKAIISPNNRYTFTMKGTGTETWTKGECSKSNIFVDGQAASTKFTTAELDFKGSEDNPYLITCAADLALLRNNVNNGTDYTDEFFKLTTDIHVVAATWTPIGTSSAKFSGTFDGDGHTISGQLIGSSSEKHLGFFNYINGATISNLTMDATVTNNFTPESGRTCYTGGIVGLSELSHLFACVNRGSVTGNGIVAGIMGYNDQSNVVACINTAAIKSYAEKGEVGGIVGRSSTSCTVTACYSTGTVSSEFNFIGAILGNLNNPESDNCKVNYCCWVSTSTSPTAAGGLGNGAMNNNRYNTVATLNSTEGVDNLNAGITAWNTAHTSTPKLQCLYIFAAGTGEEPPILVVAAPK